MMEESNAIGGGIEIEPSDGSKTSFHNQEFKEWEENKNLEWEENNFREYLDHIDYLEHKQESVYDGSYAVYDEKSGVHVKTIRPEYKTVGELFDILVLEDECKNKDFIKWLMYNKDFFVEKFWFKGGDASNYKFKYRNEANKIRKFYIIGGEIDAKDHVTAMTEIREFYDQYKKEELNKIMKKAGIATAIGVSLIATITGLALGLKRKGNDMVRDSKKTPWSKIVPGKKLIPHGVPWSEIENASGKWLIFIGDNIYLVIGGTLIYLYTK